MKLPNQEILDLIHQEIARENGTISFAHFMDLALYTPELGFYTGRTSPFGEQGDFMTAPHLSPLFARCIAREYQPLFAEGLTDILEIGAGTGLFAKDLLLYLEENHALPTHYFIYEKSLYLREIQLATFAAYPHLLERVYWLDSLTDVAINGLIFANEVLDALPFHSFLIKNKMLYERRVMSVKQSFDWHEVPATGALLTYFNQDLMDIAWPEHYISEINLAVPPFMQSLANALKQGVILLLDYGYGRADYYHPDRTMGTLMCYHQQRRHDNPFLHVGLQDITAHVDFTLVLQSAIHSGCEPAGYTTQAAFLIALGILEWAEDSTLSTISQLKQTNAIKKLLLPTEMGEAIKVIAFSKDYHKPLSGFSFYERSRDLLS